MVMNLSRESATSLTNTCISTEIYLLQETLILTIGNPDLENIMHLFDLTTLINTPTCYPSH